MKKILLLLITIFTIHSINAPSWELDPAFGTGGVIHTQVGNGSAGHAVAIQSDGKIIVAGRSFNSASVSEFVCVRYSNEHLGFHKQLEMC